MSHDLHSVWHHTAFYRSKVRDEISNEPRLHSTVATSHLDLKMMLATSAENVNPGEHPDVTDKMIWALCLTSSCWPAPSPPLALSVFRRLKRPHIVLLQNCLLPTVSIKETFGLICWSTESGIPGLAFKKTFLRIEFLKKSGSVGHYNHTVSVPLTEVTSVGHLLGWGTGINVH